jgi:hypothetical protein
MAEADEWVPAQKRLPNGKVDVRIIIAEGQRRGYCICPKPMRQMIDFKGLHCSWCGQEETGESWKFWYGDWPSQTSSSESDS